jgi:DNA repair protein RecO (recombination protein O)
MRLGDADKLVTFFTLRYGKIKVVAKGAYKTKSRLGGRLEPFGYGNVIYFGKEKADLFRLNSIDSVDPFLAIHSDLSKISRAWVAAEFVDICQRERDVNREGFALLLTLFQLIAAEPDVDRQNLTLRAFELKYLTLIGFRPVVDRCVDCGVAVASALRFNPRRGGVVCSKCTPNDPYAGPISAGAVKMMERLIGIPLTRASRMGASGGIYDELSRAINGQIAAHFNRGLRSEPFLAL